MKKNCVFVFMAGIIVALFSSCVSTRTYSRTNDKLYEDGVLVSENYREVLRHQAEDGTLQGEKLKGTKTTFYYDLSDAGYIQTDSAVNMTGKAGERKSTGRWKAHSFVAKKTVASGKENTEIEYSLVETVFAEVVAENGDDVSAEQKVFATVIGRKQFFVNDRGAVVSDDDGKKFSGDTFSDDDEVFFDSILAMTLPKVLSSKSDVVSEDAGKSYKTEESFESIIVESTPNQKYIFYSIAGKPFVIAGSAAWNMLKCAGYALINFAGGYQLLTGGRGFGKDETYWLMPSFKSAHKKFEDAKANNAVPYYPEYHLPFTDNKITVKKIEQETGSAFITPETAVVKRESIEHFDNTMAVSRSASADAAYTAGVVGVIGTGVTIPVSVVSWIGGAVVGVMSQMKN